MADNERGGESNELQRSGEIQSEILKAVSDWEQRVKPLKGRHVNILSNYNGQDYGRSKKSLKGTEQVIAHAMVSDIHGVMISLEGYEYGCPFLEISEWELLSE